MTIQARKALATDVAPRVDPQEPVPGCTAPRG